MIAAAVIAIFPLNWIRLSLTGQLPQGANPNTAWLITFIVIAVDLVILCWALKLRTRRLVGEGLPEDQLSFRGQMRFVAAQKEEKRQAEAERHKSIAAAQAAQFAEAETGQLQPVHPTNAIIHRGETAYASISAQLCEIKTIAYQGRSSGVSVRVATGVTIRSGSYKGAPRNEMQVVATGELLVTNSRVIFAGDRKSLSINLSSLVAVDRKQGGFVMSESSKTHFFKVSQTHESALFEVVLKRLIAEI